MTTAVGRRTTTKIINILAARGIPATVPELSAATGKSYGTVAAALKQGGAVLVPDSYPHEWTIGPSTQVRRALPTHRDEDLTEVPLKAVDTIVSMWVKDNGGIVKQLRAIKVSQSSDPKKLVEQFTNAASVFASMAVSIDKVADKPDWYEILIGENDGDIE